MGLFNRKSKKEQKTDAMKAIIEVGRNAIKTNTRLSKNVARLYIVNKTKNELEKESKKLKPVIMELLEDVGKYGVDEYDVNWHKEDTTMTDKIRREQWEKDYPKAAEALKLCSIPGNGKNVVKITKN